MEDLWLPIVQGGSSTLFLGVCWWITRRVLRGDLVPRQSLLDALADRDYYRTAHDTQQAITLKQGMTLEKLAVSTEKVLANNDAILHVVQEIQRAGGGT